MWKNAHDIYMEERVLAADPLELVHLLYQGCVSAVRDARQHLAEGAILARARAISKAGDILSELTSSLDYERGGDISRQLDELYGYMQRRLVDANCHQSDEPLAEVETLLATLQEAWDGVRRTNKPPARAETPWMQIPQEAELARVSSGWSF